MVDQPDIAHWVPQGAKEAIRSLWQSHPDKESRKRLSRLSTYPVMRTHVWGPLSHLKQGLEGQVIEAAFTYSRPDVISSALMNDPFGPGQVPSDSFYGPPVGLDFAGMVTQADSLRVMMLRAKPNIADLWPVDWPGCPPTTYDQVMEMLSNIADFFDDHHTDWSDWRADLPQIRKRRSANAAQCFFAPAIEKALTQIYEARPTLSVVSALTEVIFDLSEGIADDTTRSRLRIHRTDSGLE